MKQNDLTFDFEDYLNHNLHLSEHQDIYCKDFQNGNCFRKNCKFYHVKLDNAVVCKHWLRGLCKKNKNCEFLHEYNLKKMPECFFFSKYGECSNQECVFLHIDPNSISRECLWYKRGFCRHGLLCRNKHVKKRLCLNYFYGFCKDGPNCPYGHPKSEMPVFIETKVDPKDLIRREKPPIDKDIQQLL
ncbi:Polyadenylation factor I complex, subunit, Yth1 (CPSF subunit) [Pseudoloma neurophilia]|uniref:mRNA 3'-end-processing protein n=1 Tax=Pseudoloma neurophilia TaxID=146866 RepID=A0A0R0LU31_9MICR|nr:Polyadenylation factor I complex, subunit, Yth1 (CPSF subunit) [Pseudoloma neurophilia]